MQPNDTAKAVGRPLLIADIEPRMAKAGLNDIRKPDLDTDFRLKVAAAVREATKGRSLKELSDLVKRDERQLSRWKDGTERPHLDALFAAPELRQPLVIALAAIAGESVETETVIRVRVGGVR